MGVYIDTEFIVDLLRGVDGAQRAAKCLQKHCGASLWLSAATLTELLYVANAYSLNPEQLLNCACELALVDPASELVHLRASRHMIEHDLKIAEALEQARIEIGTMLKKSLRLVETIKDQAGDIQPNLKRLPEKVDQMHAGSDPIKELATLGRGLSKISATEIAELQRQARKTIEKTDL